MRCKFVMGDVELHSSDILLSRADVLIPLVDKYFDTLCVAADELLMRDVIAIQSGNGDMYATIRELCHLPIREEGERIVLFVDRDDVECGSDTIQVYGVGTMTYTYDRYLVTHVRLESIVTQHRTCDSFTMRAFFDAFTVMSLILADNNSHHGVIISVADDIFDLDLNDFDFRSYEDYNYLPGEHSRRFVISSVAQKITHNWW